MILETSVMWAGLAFCIAFDWVFILNIQAHCNNDIGWTVGLKQGLEGQVLRTNNFEICLMFWFHNKILLLTSI